jgi:hypothetical protein
MTKEDILTMASESYCWHVNLSGDRAASIARLDRFAALVAAAEREACSKTCEEYARKYAKDDDDSKAQAWMMLQCAAAIRARGQSEIS